jgi:hypothetical protein
MHSHRQANYTNTFTSSSSQSQKAPHAGVWSAACSVSCDHTADTRKHSSPRHHLHRPHRNQTGQSCQTWNSRRSFHCRVADVVHASSCRLECTQCLLSCRETLSLLINAVRADVLWPPFSLPACACDRCSGCLQCPGAAVLCVSLVWCLCSRPFVLVLPCCGKSQLPGVTVRAVQSVNTCLCARALSRCSGRLLSIHEHTSLS